MIMARTVRAAAMATIIMRKAAATNTTMTMTEKNAAMATITMRKAAATNITITMTEKNAAMAITMQKKDAATRLIIMMENVVPMGITVIIPGSMAGMNMKGITITMQTRCLPAGG